MKKAVLLLCICLSVLFLTGCGSSAEQPLEPDTQAPFAEAVLQGEQSPAGDRRGSEAGVFDIIEIEDRNYWEKEGCIPVSGDILDDAETAAAAANLILARFQRDGLFGGYSLQQIEYQADPGIWVFHFWDGSDRTGPGADFSVAIRKDDAQVVKMWVGE